MAGFICFGLSVLFISIVTEAEETAGKMRSNIIFILTDDQDSELGGLIPLQKSKELIGNFGAVFENSFVTTPLCCPSRSSILTGRYSSSIHVRNNSLSGNCSSSEWQKSFENKTFVNILHSAGYDTFFAGKYLNQYGRNGHKHIPPGWSDWNGLVGNSVYYNYTLFANGIDEKHGDSEDDYLTDIITKKSLNFLKKHVQTQNRKPFFMMLSPPACHSPFAPANKYKTKFSGLHAPRTPNFNRHSLDKHWLVRTAQSPMGNESVKIMDEAFVNRWRTLLSVDDMVEQVLAFLEINNLENTYVVFTSDNGFHLGQFSLPIDKRQLYEFDIRVPLLVRGPNIRPRQFRKEPVLNIDLASTFLDMAGLLECSGLDTDGKSWLPYVADNYKESMANKSRDERNFFIVEHEGEADSKIPSCPQLDHQNVANCYPECVCEDSRNNTYKCLRVLDNITNIMFCLFSDNENFVELYDLNKDPYQLINMAFNINSSIIQELVHILLSMIS